MNKSHLKGVGFAGIVVQSAVLHGIRSSYRVALGDRGGISNKRRGLGSAFSRVPGDRRCRPERHLPPSWAHQPTGASCLERGCGAGVHLCPVFRAACLVGYRWTFHGIGMGFRSRQAGELKKAGSVKAITRK